MLLVFYSLLHVGSSMFLVLYSLLPAGGPMFLVFYSLLLKTPSSWCSTARYLLEALVLGVLHFTTHWRPHVLGVLVYYLLEAPCSWCPTACYWLEAHVLGVPETTYLFEQQTNQVGIFLLHSAIQRCIFPMSCVHICSNLYETLCSL